MWHGNGVWPILKGLHGVYRGYWGQGLRTFRSAVMVSMLAVLAGCSTDVGSFTDSQPAPAQQASIPQTNQPVPYGQPAPNSLPPVPPQGQAAFAPAPKPGGGFATNSVGQAPTPAPAFSGRKLSEGELRQLLTGKSITVADGRTLEYGRSGSYQESRNGQAIAVGTYLIRDVSVCIQFTTGLTRCDSLVQDGDRLFVEDRNGQRLPAQVG